MTSGASTGLLASLSTHHAQPLNRRCQLTAADRAGAMVLLVLHAHSGWQVQRSTTPRCAQLLSRLLRASSGVLSPCVIWILLLSVMELPGCWQSACASLTKQKVR